MPYPKCKIYSDRSHFVAIPHTERPYKPRRKVQEEEIVLEEREEQGEQEDMTPQADFDTDKQAYEEQVLEEIGKKDLGMRRVAEELLEKGDEEGISAVGSGEEFDS